MLLLFLTLLLTGCSPMQESEEAALRGRYLKEYPIETIDEEIDPPLPSPTILRHPIYPT